MSGGVERCAGRTVAVFADAVGRGVGDENDHFAGVRAPVEVQGIPEGSCDGFGAIAAAARVEGLEVLMDAFDVRGKAKVLGDVGVILRGVVAKGDEADAEVIRVGEPTVGDNVGTDALDMDGRVGDVGSLGARRVLDEHKIAAGG